MNILFLSCAYSESSISLFQKRSNRGFQFAAQNFQTALFEGFLNNNLENFTVVSIPSLSTFPVGCKLPIVKNCSFMFKGKQIGESVGYINLPFINSPNDKKVHKSIDNWYSNTDGKKCIVVYAMLKMQMKYAVEAKLRHPDIRLCLIVPDLPMYMACNKYYRMLGMQNRDVNKINKMVNNFDFFVALSEPMIHQLGVSNKPYVIIEGIFNDDIKYNNVPKFSDKTIMYAGGIVSRYGVFDLIEAFTKIQNDCIRLILCGPCPELEKLNYFLRKDSRIKYLGLLSTPDVRQLERKVHLLVNPRHSTEEFTKYSFPSKTIEYMASGTPVLMSPLPSMPDEYKEYLYLFDDESIDGMKTKLEATLNIEPEILKAKGKSASEYILKNKNSKVQVSKIIELLKNV